MRPKGGRFHDFSMDRLRGGKVGHCRDVLEQPTRPRCRAGLRACYEAGKEQDGSEERLVERRQGREAV